MAGTVLGFMKFVLAFDTIAFKKGMTAAEKDLVRLQKKVEKFGKGMADLGKSMSLSVSGPLAAFALLGIKEARETEEAMAQVSAGLASMGNVSQKTAAELKAFADQMEMHSLYEADEILRGVTSTLLTFGNISGPIFDRAQQAVVDLATKLKTDLQSAAILVGKALNDPVKGMVALARAGVQMDPAAKAYIKSLVAMGDTAKAQTIILAELEREFKGSAQAAQDVDPFNQLADAYRNLSEELGTTLLPYLKTGAQDATTLAGKFRALDSDTKGWLLTIGLIVALTGPFLYLLGNIIKIAAGFRLLVLFGAGLGAVAVGETAAASGAYALGAGLRFMLGPIGWTIVAFEALHHTLEAFPKLKNAVVGFLTGVGNYIQGPLLQSILNVLPELRLLYMLMKAVGKVAPAGKVEMPAHLDPKFADPGVLYKDFGPKLENAIIPPIQKVGKKAKDEFKKLAADIQQVMDRLFPEEAAQRQYELELALLGNAAALRKMGYNADQAADAIARLNAEQAKAAKDKAAEARSKLLDPLKPILQRLFPEKARTAEFNKELQIITANMAALGAGEDSVAEATKRLQDEFKAEPLKKAAEAIGPIMDRLFPKTARANQFATELAAIEKNMVTLGYTAEQIQDVVGTLTTELAADTDRATADVITAYGDMAVGVINSTKQISETLKSGDLLGTLQHFLELVLNVVNTLARLGVIGGSSGTAPTAPAPSPGMVGARARGGPVRGGGAYLVGERGPEIFSPRRGGYVHPNAAMGQARVMVVPSAYFDVVVDRRAANVAAPIAGQAAIMGMVGGEMRLQRLNRRNLP